MAWNQLGPQRAVGVREILLHPYGDNTRYAFLDATSSLSFNPRFNSGELRGADSLAETAAIREALEWDFTAGGFDPDTYGIVYGIEDVAGGVDGGPDEHRLLKIRVGENLPYFTAYAIASDDEIGDHLVVLYRCKLTTDNTSGFSYGSFFTVGGSGLALPDPDNDNNLMKLSTHTQRVDVYEESGALYQKSDDDFGRYPYGFREAVVQRKFFSNDHLFTRFEWEPTKPVITNAEGSKPTYVTATNAFGSGFAKGFELPAQFTTLYPDGNPKIDYASDTTGSSPNKSLGSTALASSPSVPFNKFSYEIAGTVAGGKSTIPVIGSGIDDTTLQVWVISSTGNTPESAGSVELLRTTGTPLAGEFAYNSATDEISVATTRNGSILYVKYTSNRHWVGVATAIDSLFYNVVPTNIYYAGGWSNVSASNVNVYLTQSRTEFGTKTLSGSNYDYIPAVVEDNVVTELGYVRVFPTGVTGVADRDPITIQLGRGDAVHYSRISSAENFTFTPVIGSAEQMGNDTITAANGRINNATAEFKIGGVEMAAQLIMFNKVFSVATRGNGDLVYTQPTRGGDTMPFFNLQGMSQANDAESTAIVEAPRAQTSADTDGFNDQEYQNNTISLNLLRWGRRAPTQEDQRVCLIYRNYKRFTNLPDRPQAYV